MLQQAYPLTHAVASEGAPIIDDGIKACLKSEQIAHADAERARNGADAFQGWIAHAAFHAGEVGYMDACAVRDFLLRKAAKRPQRAYVSAKCELISVHLTGTLLVVRL